MTAHVLLTRRMLLKDMGRAGLAVMVLGAAACASESGNATTTAGRAEDPTTTAGGDPTSTTRAQTTTTEAVGVPAPGHQWHRVDLGFVSAYILYRGGEAAIVDTGVGGSAGSIEAGLTAVGLGWEAVGNVIVTHNHPDHQGSLPEVLAAAPSANWYAGAEDMGTISASDGIIAADGDQVFDLDIISTPGHTPGHLAVFDQVGGVLVAGDALNGGNGGVTGPNAQFSSDMAAANASVAKLAGFDYEVALFGHGEPVLTGASNAVAALAAGY